MSLVWRLLFLLALLLPDLPLDPFRGNLPPSPLHPLGTDALGRDALRRLLQATAQSLGFASACASLALLVAGGLSWRGGTWGGALSALRAVPPLLFLLPLSAALGGLPRLPLALGLALLLALPLEPALRLRLVAFRRAPAWAAERTLGARWPFVARRWAPWAWDQAAALFPTAWLGALWGEATLSALGLGPGPDKDSLGRLLAEELPRLGLAGTPLGWATLAMALGLAALNAPRGR